MEDLEGVAAADLDDAHRPVEHVLEPAAPRPSGKTAVIVHDHPRDVIERKKVGQLGVGPREPDIVELGARLHVLPPELLIRLGRASAHVGGIQHDEDTLAVLVVRPEGQDLFTAVPVEIGRDDVGQLPGVPVVAPELPVRIQYGQARREPVQLMGQDDDLFPAVPVEIDGIETADDEVPGEPRRPELQGAPRLEFP